MFLYGKEEKHTIPAQYADFTPSDPSRLFLRNITSREYGAIDSKYKNKLSLALNRSTVISTLVFLFMAAGVIHSLGLISKKESDGWLMLFIFSMVGLFMGVIAYMTLVVMLDRFVSSDALVTAGEVVDMTIIRGSRGAVIGAHHVIAIPGSRQIVTIKDNPPVTVGSTVIVVKASQMPYHIYPVPSYAADLDLVAENYAAEIEASDELPYDDYSKYDKVSLSQAGSGFVSESEYKEIPAKYRTVNILGHGAASVCWVIFALLSAGLLGGAVYCYRIHSLEGLIVTLAGFFSSVVIDLIITPEIFRQQLPKELTSCVECVPIKKTSIMGHCLISAVIPENKQYIDNIEVDPGQYDEISENVPVRIYYNKNLNIVKYVSRRYDAVF